MIIYKDVFTGDELFGDSFPIADQGVVLEVECKMVTKEEGDYGISANADEGETAESLQTSKEQVINVVDAHRLKETGFTKKLYMGHIRGYMQRLKAHLEKTQPERVKPFMEEAQGFVKKILANYDDYSFYTGESMDPDAMCPILFYRPDGMTPCFYFFKDGCTVEKY